MDQIYTIYNLTLSILHFTDTESEMRTFDKEFNQLNVEARKELEEKRNSRCVEILEDELTSLLAGVSEEHSMKCS